jgi:hypothetical protein
VLGKQKNNKISAKESLGYFVVKKHKPRFDLGCPKLLDQKKQVKMQTAAVTGYK